MDAHGRKLVHIGKAILLIVFVLVLLVAANVAYDKHLDKKQARFMVDYIEEQVQRLVDGHSDQAQVLAYVKSWQAKYLVESETEDGAMLEVRIPGIPTGARFVCDAVGDLLLTFHFNRQGRLVSYETGGVSYGCI